MADHRFRDPLVQVFATEFFAPASPRLEWFDDLQFFVLYDI